MNTVQVKTILHTVLDEETFEDKINDTLRHLQYDLNAEIERIECFPYGNGVVPNIVAIITFRYFRKP